jgi:hypothetical protein
MKKIFSSLLVFLIVISFPLGSVLKADDTQLGTANVTINPGDLLIHYIPATLDFSDYTIGNSNAVLNLQVPFKLAVDDFTGSYAGWNLTMTVGNLVSGADNLVTPTLNSDFSGVTINDADASGLESTADVSVPGTFTSTGGALTFASAKKILSAQAANPDATSRHFFNFPANSFELSFKNTTKAGAYSGVTTFALVASP